MRKTKIRRKVGDVIKVRLRENLFSFARVLEEPVVAFHNYAVNNSDVDIGGLLPSILSSDVIFRINVMNYSITSGRWMVVGHSPLSSSLREPCPFFKWDIISERLFITYTGDEEFPATFEECRGLERAMVWEPEQVEERLLAHFSGEVNPWTDAPGPINWKRY